MKAIIKADDFIGLNSKWLDFIKCLNDYNVYATFGVVSKRLMDKSLLYYIVNGGHEIFNHGYTHRLNEFRGKYKHQLNRLKASQEILGEFSYTFGAPGNRIDENTTKAIDVTNSIKVWLFGDPCSKKMVLTNFNQKGNVFEDPKGHPRSVFEKPTKHPNYEWFLSKYDESMEENAEFFIMQTHPTLWSPNDLKVFSKALEFLINDKVEFILPYEYYRSVEKIARS